MKIKLFNTVIYYTGIFSFLNKKLIIRILRSSYLLRKKKTKIYDEDMGGFIFYKNYY